MPKPDKSLGERLEDLGVPDGEIARVLRENQGVVSRSDYGSTVEGRDVTPPLAPLAVHERGSAARDDQSPGDDTRATPDGPSVTQPSLLDQCPACMAGHKTIPNLVGEDGNIHYCKDEWHDS